MALDPKDILPWLQLLDVGLAYVDQIRTNMNNGVPATKEQFEVLHNEFLAERERVGNIVANMPPDSAPANAAATGQAVI